MDYRKDMVVNIGEQNFASIRERDTFYVDKTNFIKEWWDEGSTVTLITRPRRFGKTLNMSMLECFFSNKYKDRSELFEDLSIWEEEKYREIQGTYPVIFLSFAKVKSSDYRGMEYSITKIISDLYESNRYLLESDFLSENQKEYFKSIKPGISKTVAADAVNSLTTFLSEYYGKKVIILLDEYDTPMQEAWLGGYWDEAVEFFRSFFNATFKTNPNLERGIITGITRISKESIFSDLNNPEVVTTTSDKYASCFGFTEEEVFEALDGMGLGGEKQGVKSWYDGFTFGNITDIYNPWSITSFISSGGKYRTYWADTSSNGLVSRLIREGSRGIKQSFEMLLKGQHIFVEIDEQIVYNQLDGNENAIWSLLLASGYLKVISIDDSCIHDNLAPVKYELALTNREVYRMFASMVRGWFDGAAKTEYNEFIEALLLNDKKAMNRFMNDVALNTFSYFDTGNKTSKSAPERFYHGFVLGLLVELSGRYTLTSNRESGFGRYDVMLEPKDKSDNAYIMEFKVHDKDDDEKTLKDTVANALAQIENKKYEAVLLEKGIPKEKIYKYGFAFEGKNVLIGD